MEQSVENLQAKTNETLGQIQPRLPNLEEAPLPIAVFHYTDAVGFKGIMESGKLWATDYRYLNDSSELRYIFNLARQAAEDIFRYETTTGLAHEFLRYIATASPPYEDTVYWICCFSELDNSLSQWRAYGGRQGFSVGFPGDITLEPGLVDVPGRQGQTPGITLLKVEYRAERHAEYVDALIRELIELCGSPHMQDYEETDVAISHISPFYFGQLERASYRFKHPDFADEREWRLLSWDGRKREFFRVGVTLTPYTEFRLFSASHPNANSNGLPLVAVRHGPTPLPHETKLAMDRFLLSQGYPVEYCERRGSDTPVRL